MTPTHSRPLTALAVVLTGWIGLRVAVLGFWPAPPAAPGAAEPTSRPAPLPEPAIANARTRTVAIPGALPAAAASRVTRQLWRTAAKTPLAVTPAPHASPPPLALAFPPSAPTPAPVARAEYALPPAPRTPAQTANSSRFSASLWLLERFEGGGTTALSERGLGGSQTGARLFYGPNLGLALTARASAALHGPGKEASLGLALRGRTGGLLLERRVALDRGGRDAFAATAYAGAYDLPLPARFRLDAYLQAGMVGLRRRDAFADGEVSVERPLAGPLGLGVFARAAAQPGVRRLDTGPQLTLRLGATRLTAGYARRIAGNAAPASGPTLAAGFDF